MTVERYLKALEMLSRNDIKLISFLKNEMKSEKKFGNTTNNRRKKTVLYSTFVSFCRSIMVSTPSIEKHISYFLKKKPQLMV